MFQKSMTLKPIGGQIIGRVVEESKEKMTASGIIIPETANKTEFIRVEVLQLGPGALLPDGTRAKQEVEVGDIVLIEKYSKAEVEIDLEKFVVIKDQDSVIAVITK